MNIRNLWFSSLSGPSRNRVRGSAERTVQIRWTCSDCGETNTRSVDLKTVAARTAGRSADAQAEAHLANRYKVDALKAIRQSWAVYRSMDLYCPCARCGHTELWSRKRRSHVGRALPTALGVLVTVAGAAALIAAVVFPNFETWPPFAVIAAIFGCAAGWGFAVTAVSALLKNLVYAHMDKQLEACPDSSFPLMTADPTAEAEAAIKAQRANSAQPVPFEHKGDNGSFWDSL